MWLVGCGDGGGEVGIGGGGVAVGGVCGARVGGVGVGNTNGRPSAPHVFNEWKLAPKSRREEEYT
jgi:hypothetical protein